LYLSDSARRPAAIAADRGEFRRAYELSVEAASMADRATRERASRRRPAQRPTSKPTAARRARIRSSPSRSIATLSSI
jgi:hypothetical protein